MIRTIISIFHYFYYALRSYFHKYWILFNRFLFEPWVDSKREFSHKIVIIGDEFALGYGDWVVFGGTPGLGSRITSLLQRETKIRQRWRVYNRGEIGSTSESWLPKAESVGFCFCRTSRTFVNRGTTCRPKKSRKEDNLFAKTFDNSRYANADMVVILVGSNDCLKGNQLEPTATLSNIKDIAENLAKSGKFVYVCSIPNFGDTFEAAETRQKNEERNKLLQEWLKSPKYDKIIAGPRLDLSNFEYKRKAFYWFDGVHFNSKGYKKVAEDLTEILLHDCVKIEFAEFSKKLGFNKG
ncbi:SGNH hydrolase-type esterase domain-containing protein [Paraphysoderma sedebokerense]|nr:SGNH hydrolase-type esterase domain-containing protein [Paraphysoderma sedebokerense]